MRLTDRCRGIIAGAILGDGCLERNGRFVRLRIDHGERQKALVEWKHKQLAELSPTPIRRVTVLDQRTGKTYVHYRFENALRQSWKSTTTHSTAMASSRCRPRSPRISPLPSVLQSGTWMMAAEGQIAAAATSTLKGSPWRSQPFAGVSGQEFRIQHTNPLGCRSAANLRSRR
jgi:hypothetical protein